MHTVGFVYYKSTYTFTPEKLLSESEYKELQGYEPSKITLTYDEYVQRTVKHNEKGSPATATVNRTIYDLSNAEITQRNFAKVESSPDFIGWINPETVLNIKDILRQK